MTPKINWKPTTKDLRQFGVVIWIGFAILAAIAYWRHHPSVAAWTLIVPGIIGCLAIFAPPMAKPFYWLWMGFGFVLGTIMSRIVLALIYFGLFTPIALFFRLIRRDPLKLRRNERTDSYWQEHPEIHKADYSRLF